MQGLVDDHKYARNVVGDIVAARKQYTHGDDLARATIIDGLHALILFYPGHIEKEDKEIFPITEKYFNAKELDQMLDEFRKFDKGMIHEKYKNLVKELST